MPAFMREKTREFGTMLTLWMAFQKALNAKSLRFSQRNALRFFGLADNFRSDNAVESDAFADDFGNSKSVEIRVTRMLGCYAFVIQKAQKALDGVIRIAFGVKCRPSCGDQTRKRCGVLARD